MIFFEVYFLENQYFTTCCEVSFIIKDFKVLIHNIFMCAFPSLFNFQRSSSPFGDFFILSFLNSFVNIFFATFFLRVRHISATNIILSLNLFNMNLTTIYYIKLYFISFYFLYFSIFFLYRYTRSSILYNCFILIVQLYTYLNCLKSQ